MVSSLTADWPHRTRTPLPPHEVHLYFMRLDGFAAPPPALYELLNQAERERCARYLFMRNRIESTALPARWLALRCRAMPRSIRDSLVVRSRASMVSR